MNKPNLNLPLASSYNERGVAGYTNTVTNRIDQQKVNSYYEVTKNSITGQGRLNLTKRPGVKLNSNFFGVSSQAAYAICNTPGANNFLNPLVFSVFNTNIVVNGPSGSAAAGTIIQTLSSGSAYIPCYLDSTFINSVNTIVLQNKIDFLPHRVFFSTNGSSWTEIVDTDFTSLNHLGKMEHMDGYAFILDATGNVGRIFNSDLNSLANWTSTNFITKSIIQDVVSGLAKHKNQILAFGAESVEAFYNAGNATGSPLSSIKQLSNRVGLQRSVSVGGTHYYDVVGDFMYFVGRNSGGSKSTGVFSYNGTTYEKVSTPFIDKILSENSFYSVRKIGFFGKTAVAISLTISTASTQRWLMFFPEWKDWFEWNSSVFGPLNSDEMFLGVSPNQNRVYSFGELITSLTDNWQDDGTSYQYMTQFKLPQSGHQRTRMAEFGVLGDTARASNQLLVEFSDDDDQSFYTVGNIELARDIKTLNRGGSYRQRTVRLSSTNALETRLSSFIARIE
jgi:hypothetical protein